MRKKAFGTGFLNRKNKKRPSEEGLFQPNLKLLIFYASSAIDAAFSEATSEDDFCFLPYSPKPTKAAVVVINLSGLLDSSIFFHSFLPTPGAPENNSEVYH